MYFAQKISEPNIFVILSYFQVKHTRKDQKDKKLITITRFFLGRLRLPIVGN